MHLNYKLSAIHAENGSGIINVVRWAARISAKMNYCYIYNQSLFTAVRCQRRFKVGGMKRMMKDCKYLLFLNFS